MYKFYTWPAPGITNQMEHRYSHLLNFVRRGLTGNYLDTANFYKMVSEAAFPRSDGFDWKDKPTGEKRYFDEPTATSVNAALAMNNRIDGEHAHWYGMPDYYMMSGDETIKEAIVDGPRDYYLDSTSTNNLINMGKIWDARFVGAVLMGLARTSVFLNSIGDTASAATLLSRCNTVWTLQIKPDLCASGYPAGCVPSLDGTDTGVYQRGTSKVRGVTFQWGDTSIDNTGCSFAIDRSHVPFENGILVQGMSELRQAYGPSWADYTAIYDVMYGITQGNFGEMFSDDGTNSWAGKGFRYKAAIDYPSTCSANFRVQNPNAFWPMFTLRTNYEGAATASVWKRKLGLTLQSVISGGSAIRDELYQYTIANAIYAVNHPPLSLNTVPITGFTDNGGGSYTISWAVPSGTQSYRIKWYTSKIVDYIGYDAATATFIGNPAATMNWFAATDAPSVSAPSGTTQSFTIATATTGLTAANFMVKAYVTGAGGGSIDVTPPSVGVTGPSSGATVSNSITLTAAASDNVAVTSLQFKLDGANLGSPIAGAGPYTLSWDTTKVSNGTHVITAAAFDAAGNGALSSPISISVSNSTGSTGSGGTLSAAFTSPTGTIQLTTTGTADWAHWGLNTATDFNHKAGVTQQISNFTLVGTVAPTRYANSTVGFTWTDGTPTATASATASSTGLYVSGQNNGFSLSVPADTTQRTVVLYLGAWRNTGRLVAHLSDGSAPDYVDTSLTNNAGSTTVGAYTLTYQAGSSGQTLNLTYTMTGASGGNVTLQAATLVAGAPVPNFTVSANPSAATLAAGANITPSIAVAASNGFAGAVALTATGQPGGVTVAFNPVSVTGTGSSALTITASAGAAAGTYPITVTGTSGSLVRTATVTLTVAGAATAGPVISSVGAAAVSSSGATVTWATDSQSDSQVTYGPTTSYGSTSSRLPSMVTSHSVPLTGLTDSTTYHYKVISRNTAGLQSTSSDFTFTTPAAGSGSGGAGTPITTNTWTPIVAHGVPAQVLGYDKSVYVNSRKIHCIWGAYHEPISSEPNNATVCYSYVENRWFVLENNGMWHSDHAPSSGHTSSLFAYMPDRDTIVSVTDGSGSNVPEKFLAHWWWFDVAGLSGQDKEFTPKPWLGATTPTSAMTYDSFNSKLVIFPNLTGATSVCDPATNSCAAPATTGTAPASTVGDLSLVYNTADHKVYLFGGGQNDVYTFNVATNAWTKLATTCTGAACVSGKPPARMAAGFAYSTVDNVFLMAGGSTFLGGQAFFDTWIFDSVRLAWTQQTPPAPYANNSNNTTFDRVTYDADSNVFLLMASGGVNTYADGNYGAYTVQVWAYAYSAAANYGRSSTTFNPPASSMNRVAPASLNQSWAMDPAITASGGIAYTGWIETGAPFDTSSCGLRHPYVQSGSSITNWTMLPGGGQAAACASIDPEPSTSPSYTDASKLRLAVVNGSLWEAHEKWNNSTTSSSAWAKSWNGLAWVGGAVGCFTDVCSTSLPQNPQALIANGAAPTIAVIEENHNVYVPEGYLYVAQWNGSKWAALGGKLNIGGSGTRALFATLASNGTNPAACWSEEVSSSRSVVTTTPQIQCAQWSGSAWTRFGTGSLNRAATSWAYSPSMTYLGGKYYIGWVERTTAGANKLYVCRWDGSTCTLLGGAAINMNASTGWAAHPSLANDGTSLYVAWEEQAATGAKSLGYVKKWDGSVWSQVGSILNADPVLGSASGISLAVVQGAPTAIWTELSYGNLRQVYAKQWDGSNWIGTTGLSTPPTQLSCDLNGDGKIDSLDIDLATNQALGVLPCSSSDLQGIGQCTVVGVQRIINASKGAVCRIGN
ncbi:MAG: Ig-like domain-containing protein [Candidatus Solibacter sp.]